MMKGKLSKALAIVIAVMMLAAVCVFIGTSSSAAAEEVNLGVYYVGNGLSRNDANKTYTHSVHAIQAMKTVASTVTREANKAYVFELRVVGNYTVNQETGYDPVSQSRMSQIVKLADGSLVDYIKVVGWTAVDSGSTQQITYTMTGTATEFAFGNNYDFENVKLRIAGSSVSLSYANRVKFGKGSTLINSKDETPAGIYARYVKGDTAYNGSAEVTVEDGEYSFIKAARNNFEFGADGTAFDYKLNISGGKIGTVSLGASSTATVKVNAEINISGDPEITNFYGVYSESTVYETEVAMKINVAGTTAATITNFYGLYNVDNTGVLDIDIAKAKSEYFAAAYKSVVNSDIDVDIDTYTVSKGDGSAEFYPISGGELKKTAKLSITAKNLTAEVYYGIGGNSVKLGSTVEHDLSENCKISRFYGAISGVSLNTDHDFTLSPTFKKNDKDVYDPKDSYSSFVFKMNGGTFSQFYGAGNRYADTAPVQGSAIYLTGVTVNNTYYGAGVDTFRGQMGKDYKSVFYNELTDCTITGNYVGAFYDQHADTAGALVSTDKCIFVNRLLGSTHVTGTSGGQGRFFGLGGKYRGTNQGAAIFDGAVYNELGPDAVIADFFSGGNFGTGEIKADIYNWIYGTLSGFNGAAYEAPVSGNVYNYIEGADFGTGIIRGVGYSEKSTNPTVTGNVYTYVKDTVCNQIAGITTNTGINTTGNVELHVINCTLPGNYIDLAAVGGSTIGGNAILEVVGGKAGGVRGSQADVTGNLEISIKDTDILWGPVFSNANVGGNYTCTIDGAIFETTANGNREFLAAGKTVGGNYTLTVKNETGDKFGTDATQALAVMGSGCNVTGKVKVDILDSNLNKSPLFLSSGTYGETTITMKNVTYPGSKMNGVLAGGTVNGDLKIYFDNVEAKSLANGGFVVFENANNKVNGNILVDFKDGEWGGVNVLGQGITAKKDGKLCDLVVNLHGNVKFTNSVWFRLSIFYAAHTVDANVVFNIYGNTYFQNAAYGLRSDVEKEKCVVTGDYTINYGMDKTESCTMEIGVDLMNLNKMTINGDYTVNFGGGTFTKGFQSLNTGSSVIKGDHTMNISGGTFKGSVILVSSTYDTALGKSSVNISGGSFVKFPQLSGAACAFPGDVAYTISGNAVFPTQVTTNILLAGSSVAGNFDFKISGGDIPTNNTYPLNVFGDGVTVNGNANIDICGGKVGSVTVVTGDYNVGGSKGNVNIELHGDVYYYDKTADHSNNGCWFRCVFIQAKNKTVNANVNFDVYGSFEYKSTIISFVRGSDTATDKITGDAIMYIGRKMDVKNGAAVPNVAPKICPIQLVTVEGKLEGYIRNTDKFALSENTAGQDGNKPMNIWIDLTDSNVVIADTVSEAPTRWVIGIITGEGAVRFAKDGATLTVSGLYDSDKKEDKTKTVKVLYDYQAAAGTNALVFSGTGYSATNVKVVGEQEIPTPPTPPSPQTGDNGNVVLWLAVACVALAVGFGALRIRRKEN